jgi:acyl-ACP thioesterase
VLLRKGSFPVHSYEVDASGVLTPAALAGYLLETASAHASELGCGIDTLMQRGFIWVLSRLRIAVERPVVLGELLAVETWPSGVERLFALRDFRIRDAEGGVVARATSQWLVLSLETRRAVWPEEALDARAREEAERVFDEGFVKIAPLGEVEERRRFDTRYQDLDHNDHVTSRTYVTWALEAIPEATWRSSRLSFLEVHYLAEAFHPSAITSCARRIEGPGDRAYRHSIVRDSDEKELARLETRWVAR